jgi:hypothetical protein
MPTMTVGVLAAHDDAKRLAGRLTAELPAALGRRYANVEWHVRQAEADPADPVADEREARRGDVPPARSTRAGSSPSASPTCRSAFAVVRCERT